MLLRLEQSHMPESRSDSDKNLKKLPCLPSHDNPPQYFHVSQVFLQHSPNRHALRWPTQAWLVVCYWSKCQCVCVLTVLVGSTTQQRVWVRWQFRFFRVRVPHLANLQCGRPRNGISWRNQSEVCAKSNFEKSCGQTCLKIGSRHCTAIFSLQVLKACRPRSDSPCPPPPHLLDGHNFFFDPVQFHFCLFVCSFFFGFVSLLLYNPKIFTSPPALGSR